MGTAGVISTGTAYSLEGANMPSPESSIYRQIANLTGLKYQTVYRRVTIYGWHIEEASGTPLLRIPGRISPRKPRALAARRPCGECGELLDQGSNAHFCERCLVRRCEWCAKEFRRRGAERPNRFCTKVCLTEYQKTLVGSLAGNWRGGVSEPNRVKRANERQKSTKQWRLSVLDRDEYTCQRCGFVGMRGKVTKLHAHHIKPFKKFPKLRCDLSNGITLCGPCHVDAHRGRFKQFSLFRFNRGGNKKMLIKSKGVQMAKVG